jgi:hypothetical protein
MNLEKQYSDLKKKPPNKGAKATSAFLSRVGGQVAATVLTAGALFAISKIIESKFGVKIPRL